MKEQNEYHWIVGGELYTPKGIPNEEIAPQGRSSGKLDSWINTKW